MKLSDRFLLICLVLSLFIITAPAARAATLYVKPSSEITMRRGQGTDFKVIAVIKNGTPVELLSSVDDWAKVQLESGKQGWVLKRFLSPDPPLGEQVQQLQREKEVLSQTAQSLKRRADALVSERDEIEARLTDEKDQVEKQLNDCVIELTTINDKFLRLQEDTADVIQTKNDLEQAQAQVVDLETQLNLVKEDNRRLRKTETLKWFLAGGGVFFGGWLIGMISRRSRKKRSSLL